MARVCFLYDAVATCTKISQVGGGEVVLVGVSGQTVQGIDMLCQYSGIGLFSLGGKIFAGNSWVDTG